MNECSCCDVGESDGKLCALCGVDVRSFEHKHQDIYLTKQHVMSQPGEICIVCEMFNIDNIDLHRQRVPNYNLALITEFLFDGKYVCSVILSLNVQV